MKTLAQLFREFWLPFSLATVWTVYNFLAKTDPGWKVRDAVNIFGPSFFLLSWMTGQIFRVKKQAKVEDSFENIETRIKDLIQQIDTKTSEMISNVTGGDSFLYFVFANIVHEHDCGQLVALHKGSHPLYDVTANFTDVQKFSELAEKFRDGYSIPKANLEGCNKSVAVGNITPHSALGGLGLWQFEGDRQDYNVSIDGRNGRFSQLIRMRKINDEWLMATRVIDGRMNSGSAGKILLESVPEEFPRNPTGDVDWL